MNASKALERLKKGNAEYLTAVKSGGDISPEIRKRTAEEGQHPYAVIVACSDSRVIPESIFSAGIGELFVIRVAGNVLGEHELGSVEYAVGHLGVKLVVVLGHTLCGAVASAIEGHAEGHVGSIIGEIKAAAGGGTDPDTVCRMNVIRGTELVRRELGAAAQAVGAVYHTESGEVEFFL